MRSRKEFNEFMNMKLKNQKEKEKSIFTYLF